MLKFKPRFGIPELSNTIIFIAVMLRNFAIGWELVGFFPDGFCSTEIRWDLLGIGGLLLVCSLISYTIGIMINPTKGDPE